MQHLRDDRQQFVGLLGQNCMGYEINRGEVEPTFGACPGGVRVGMAASGTGIRSCEKIDFADFGTLYFQQFTLWITGPKSIFSQLRMPVLGHGQDGHATTVGTG
jgi:hypothetical protein